MDLALCSTKPCGIACVGGEIVKGMGRGYCRKNPQAVTNMLHFRLVIVLDRYISSSAHPGIPHRQSLLSAKDGISALSSPNRLAFLLRTIASLNTSPGVSHPGAEIFTLPPPPPLPPLTLSPPLSEATP
jgi:hypothetical protein